MKTLLLLMALLAAGSAIAQDDLIDPTLRTDIIRHAPGSTSLSRQPKVNEFVGHRLIFEGIAVAAVQARNPLQLINPLAPPEYGSGEANLNRDVITGKVTGLKFLAIKF